MREGSSAKQLSVHVVPPVNISMNSLRMVPGKAICGPRPVLPVPAASISGPTGGVLSASTPGGGLGLILKRNPRLLVSNLDPVCEAIRDNLQWGNKFCQGESGGAEVGGADEAMEEVGGADEAMEEVGGAGEAMEEVGGADEAMEEVGGADKAMEVGGADEAMEVVGAQEEAEEVAK